MLSFLFDGVPPLHRPEPTIAEEELEALYDTPRSVQGRARGIRSIHGPVAKKECEQCHAGRYSNRLKQEGETLCWSCHDREDFPGAVVHGPVAAGFCIGCHDPHRSKHPFLLVRAPEELCENCHDEDSFAGLADHRLERGDDCQSCHNPHAGDREFMLARDEDPA